MMFIWALRCVRKGAETRMWGDRHWITMLVPYWTFPSRDFPQTTPSGGGTPEWVLCTTLEGRVQVWESEQGWRLRPGGSEPATVESWVAPHPPPPAKPTLSLLASATVPQVLCFSVFFFFFLLSLRSLMNLWTLVGKDEDAPASGLPHPQLSAVTMVSLCSPSGQQCKSLYPLSGWECPQPQSTCCHCGMSRRNVTQIHLSRFTEQLYQNLTGVNKHSVYLFMAKVTKNM